MWIATAVTPRPRFNQRGTDMKKYQILVVMSYWNELTVEAETQDEADEKAFKLFDLNK